jgi:asparagine synthase (glutamine-hydrolysing)
LLQKTIENFSPKYVEARLMCGILGWVSHETESNGQRFEQALDLLAHRGPDDSGTYVGEGVLLGHRRLSIIDLTEAGHQPMRHQESDSVIVFNGEIFNYLELRKDLESKGYRFKTDSDTEVLLIAYIHWGKDALNKLNGMWAFAIWQPAKRKLFVARDRFGIKPFYFTLNNGNFAFASEPKALLALFPGLRSPDHLALFNFLAEGGAFIDGNSFYEGIKTIPPGTFAEFSSSTNEIKFKRYWDYPDIEPSHNVSDAEAIDDFSSLFQDSVRLRTRSDVPVGVTISGGLDSTAVLAEVMREDKNSKFCYTSVYSESDKGEEEWAKIAATPYGVSPIEVMAPKTDWLDILNKISWHMDAPGYSPAVYPLWHIMKRARKDGVFVLLEGQGADEALGGYSQYAVLSLISMLKTIRKANDLNATFKTWRRISSTFSSRASLLWLIREAFPSLVSLNRRMSGAYMALSNDFKNSIETNEDSYHSKKNAKPDYSLVTSRLFEDHSRNVLPSLLHYGDAISMAHGVESRLPFMDFRIVEWLFKNGDNFKIREGITKWVLRQHLEKVGQARIAMRKDKQGYPTPIISWLAEGKNTSLVSELLLSDNSKLLEFCDKRGIQKLFSRYQMGNKAAGNHLYRLISTEIWMRTCL